MRRVRLELRAGCAVAAIAAALLAGGCAGDDDQPAGGMSATGRSGAAAQAGGGPPRRLQLAVVAIAARIGRDDVHSSGVIIDASRGLILTSAHTLWGATSLKVATGLGVLHGRIVARSPCDDLALVETQPRLPGLVALSGGRGAGVGPAEWLSAVGRRWAGAEYGRQTVVTIPTRLAAAPGAESARPAPPSRLALEGALLPDSSGGPLLDRRGRLVGLARVTPSPDGGGSATGLAWETIRARLDQLRPGSSTVYVGWREHYRCAPRLHAYAGAAHPGFHPRDARLNAPVPASRLPGTESLDG
jgi:S1-C subfamily serine protease